MSPDCAVLGCAAGRRATRDRRQRMALFFRAQPRMFFLILLGRGCSEKNCAGFCRDLREFSRAVAGAGLAGCSDDRVDWHNGRCMPEGTPPARRLAREPRATRVSAARAVTLTIEIHSVPIGRRRRMSTTLRPIGGARSPFECTAFRVASGAGCPHPESACGSPGCRCSPSEFTARRVGFGAGYPHRIRCISSICCALSPFEYTGSRVSLSGGYPRRNTHAA